MRLTTRVILIITVCVTTLISIIFYVLTRRFDQQVAQDQLATARAIYKNVLTVRKWVSDQEGVLVHKLPGVQPNPYLDDPVWITAVGDTLVRKNPALVTRELSELSRIMGGDFYFHMASQKYLNPFNRPDSFETAALRFFSDTTLVLTQKEFFRFEEINQQRFFRYFAPLYAEESCMSCHAQQISNVGDLRGGISILLSAQHYTAVRQQNLDFMVRSALISILLLSILIFFSIRQSVIKPLRIIERGAQRISEGDYHFHIDVHKKDEIGSLARAFDAMRVKISDSTQLLRNSEKKYRALIEHSLEAIAIIDAQGCIIESSGKLAHLSGYTTTELMHKPLAELVVLQKEHHRYLRGRHGERHYETRLMTADRLELAVEIYIITGVVLDGQENLSFVYLRDLSERKKIEQYAIQTEKMYALGQISSGIAHEIRNPLFALRNNIDFLYERCGEMPQFQDTYCDILTSIDRIQTIISAVLDFSRPHQPQIGAVSVRHVIEESILLVQKQFDHSAIKIVSDFEQTHQIIEADAHQLEQVFINLFLNAFEAMQGRGTLTIVTRSVGSFVDVTIADTGRGIPAEQLPHIFDPFFTRSRNGTGLGLAIVQRILEQHGAFYRVESQVDIGTTFYISLPLRKE